jgi:putative transposase
LGSRHDHQTVHRWPTPPRSCWLGDITYISTTSDWRHLAVWIDRYSRGVVAWKLEQRMDADLVIEALNRALDQRLAQTKQR